MSTDGQTEQTEISTSRAASSQLKAMSPPQVFMPRVCFLWQINPNFIPNIGESSLTNKRQQIVVQCPIREEGGPGSGQNARGENYDATIELRCEHTFSSHFDCFIRNCYCAVVRGELWTYICLAVRDSFHNWCCADGWTKKRMYKIITSSPDERSNSEGQQRWATASHSLVESLKKTWYISILFPW